MELDQLDIHMRNNESRQTLHPSQKLTQNGHKSKRKMHTYKILRG